MRKFKKKKISQAWGTENQESIALEKLSSIETPFK